MNDYKIIEYDNYYEKSWIRCRVLSFLDSSYYDDVNIKKEEYESPSVSLIAVENDNVIGFLEMEYELEPYTVCSKNEKLGEHLAGMIWHLGTHPDYRRKGIAKELLNKMVEIAKTKKLQRLEAWTRDQKFVNDWYWKSGFVQIEEYVHWYYDARYDDATLLGKILELKESTNQIKNAFGYANSMTNEIKMLERKYFCRRFDKFL